MANLAATSGKTIAENDDAAWPGNVDIMVSLNGVVSLETVPADAVISHVVRDPRDVIVSGYFYHLWTHEEWCRTLDPRYGGRSYQEHLTAISTSEGLAAEIFRSRDDIASTVKWMKVESRPVIHVRYEDAFGNELKALAPLLDAWDLNQEEMEVATGRITRTSFAGLKAAGGVGTGHHARRDTPGDWVNHFESAHVELFKQDYAGVLETLGYDWI